MPTQMLLAAAAAAAAADNAASSFPVNVAYCVQARAEPGVMPRVLELFAKRGLVPHEWRSIVNGPALTIDVRIGRVDRDVADYIARCMRQIIGVETVLSVEDSRPSG